MRMVFAIAALAACAPGAPEHECLKWTDCGPGGACEHPARACSFPDEACDTGRRFGEYVVGDGDQSCVPFVREIGGMCDDGANKCNDNLDCVLGRCAGVTKLTASLESMNAVCKYNYFVPFSGKLPSLTPDGATVPFSLAGDVQLPALDAAIGVRHILWIDAAGTLVIVDTTAGEHAIPRQLTDVRKVSTYYDHSCVTKDDGVYCWGNNDQGQVNGTPSPRLRVNNPEPAHLSGTIDHVAAGKTFSCVAANGNVRCWGGSWAAGTIMPDIANAGRVVGLPAGEITALVAGAEHACAIIDGGLFCWGDDRNGQSSGTSMREQELIPPTAIPLGARVKNVAAGARHTCAVTETSDVWCWGDNDFGQLGVAGNPLVPTRVPDLRASGPIAAGDVFTCALFEDAITHCWGIEEFLAGPLIRFDWFPACAGPPPPPQP